MEYLGKGLNALISTITGGGGGERATPKEGATVPVTSGQASTSPMDSDQVVLEVEPDYCCETAVVGLGGVPKRNPGRGKASNYLKDISTTDLMNSIMNSSDEEFKSVYGQQSLDAQEEDDEEQCEEDGGDDLQLPACVDRRYVSPDTDICPYRAPELGHRTGNRLERIEEQKDVQQQQQRRCQQEDGGRGEAADETNTGTSDGFQMYNLDEQ